MQKNRAMNGKPLMFRLLEFYGTRLQHRGQWKTHALLRKVLKVDIDHDYEVERLRLRWLLNPSDYVEQNLFWLGERDRWDIYHIKRFLRKGAVICDVGANFGYFSVTLAAFLERDCRVFAFEPNPLTRTRLERNITLNSLTETITVVPTALSDMGGRSRLTTRKGNSGAAYINNAGEVEIELTTLDDFVARNRLSRLDFVKIDVEGLEVSVLRGGERSLIAHKPVLLVELMPQQLRRAGSSPSELVSHLRRLGYSVYVHKRDVLVPLKKLPGESDVVNVLCLPMKSDMDMDLKNQ